MRPKLCKPSKLGVCGTILDSSLSKLLYINGAQLAFPPSGSEA